MLNVHTLITNDQQLLFSFSPLVNITTDQFLAGCVPSTIY